MSSSDLVLIQEWKPTVCDPAARRGGVLGTRVDGHTTVVPGVPPDASDFWILGGASRPTEVITDLQDVQPVGTFIVIPPTLFSTVQ